MSDHVYMSGPQYGPSPHLLAKIHGHAVEIDSQLATAAQLSIPHDRAETLARARELLAEIIEWTEEAKP